MWTKIVRFLADGSKRCCSGGRRGGEVACRFLFTLRGEGGVGQEPGTAQPRALSSPLAGEDAEGRRGERCSRCFHPQAEPGANAPPLPNPLPQGERGPEAVVLQLQGSLSSANNCQRQELGAAQPRALSSPLAGEDAEGRRGERRSRCFHPQAEPGANAPLSPTLSRKGRGGQKRRCFNFRVPSPSANNCQRQAPGAA